jgi:hypothetical protein
MRGRGAGDAAQVREQGNRRQLCYNVCGLGCPALLPAARRKALGEALQAALAKLREQQAEDESAPAMPVYGAGVTITSNSAKLMAKMERKDRRRQRAGPAGGLGGA